jgi:endonuclease-3
MEVIPKAAWSDFSLQLIYLGREYCVARKPKCTVCPLNVLCPSAIRPEESLEKLDGHKDT